MALTIKNVQNRVDRDGRYKGDLKLGPRSPKLPNTLRAVEGGLTLEGYLHQLPESLERVRFLVVTDYDLPLPSSLVEVDGLVVEGLKTELPAGLRRVGRIRTGNYRHPIPAILQESAFLELEDYQHPLSSSLTKSGGLNLYRYTQPLPEGLVEIGREDNRLLSHGRLRAGLEGLPDYPYPLPGRLKHVRGTVHLGDYRHPLPDGLVELASGDGPLFLSEYKHPLPYSIESIGADLDLHKYKFALPPKLKKVSGLMLRGYSHPLPESLASVMPLGIDLSGYKFPLPSGLVSAGAIYISDPGYRYPLPAGIKKISGRVTLEKYKHPLPPSLAEVGSLDVKLYALPIPETLRTVKEDLFISDFTEIPYEMRVHGDAYATDRTEKFPENVRVDGEIFLRKGYQYPPPAPPEASEMRVFGEKTSAVLKLRREDAPEAARDFKKKFPSEFESLKRVTGGQDFTPEVKAKIRETLQSPVQWLVTFGRYSSSQQRVCQDDNVLLRLCIDTADPSFTDEMRSAIEVLHKLLVSNDLHPHTRLPLLVIGWVRICPNDEARVWLVEEIQSDLMKARSILKGKRGEVPRRIEKEIIARKEQVAVFLSKYLDNFYEDALGVVFDLAQQAGYRVEMLNYDIKEQFDSPRSVYTELPRSMGMRLSEGSEAIPGLMADKKDDFFKQYTKVPAQTWKITPNRRRTSRRKTSRGARKTSR